ncbi:hypothetical protein KY284_002863 [Solanum tuberosum]|nr:hypothetical protein KY284_002863 [Solanum tuberosum]
MQVINAAAGNTKTIPHIQGAEQGGGHTAKMGRTMQSSSGSIQILEAPPHFAFKAWEANKNGVYFDRMVVVASPNETTGNPPISNYVMNNEVCGLHL